MLLKRLQLEMSINQDRHLLPEYKKLSKLMAEKLKIYKDELIVAGFTENQALRIVIAHGVDVGRLSEIGD